MELSERLIGCLLGTAVGDSIGLPSEGLSRERIARRWPGPLRQRLVCGHGLISDDTEHAFLTAQCLVAHGQDVARFTRALSWRLRWWFAALPAGVGLATARACLRLWFGVPPGRSGVWSAGNGAAMRAPIIGVYAATDADLRRRLLVASTMMTHRDPKALVAAGAICECCAAVAAGRAVDPDTIWDQPGADEEWRRVAEAAKRSLAEGRSINEFAIVIGCPSHVSGYAYHSVPIALYGWLRHRGEARVGLEAIIRCGGDTDTTAAIGGALYGVDLGEAGLPSDWLWRLSDIPLSVATLRAAGNSLAAGEGPVRWLWPLVPLRNLIFLMIVLFHGFSRLFIGRGR